MRSGWDVFSDKKFDGKIMDFDLYSKHKIVH